VKHVMMQNAGYWWQQVTGANMVSVVGHCTRKSDAAHKELWVPCAHGLEHTARTASEGPQGSSVSLASSSVRVGASVSSLLSSDARSPGLQSVTRVCAGTTCPGDMMQPWPTMQPSLTTQPSQSLTPVPMKALVSLTPLWTVTRGSRKEWEMCAPVPMRQPRPRTDRVTKVPSPMEVLAPMQTSSSVMAVLPIITDDSLYLHRLLVSGIIHV
jgi:hypothetical protein